MSSHNIDFENFDMSELNPNYVPLEQEQQEQQEQKPAAVALADADGLTWFVPPVVADAVVNNNKQQLPCTVCHKAYVCKKFLQRHKTFHHHLCKQVQQLDCDHCGAIFADVDSHMKHLEETDSHLKEYFSVGLPQKIKQQQRAANLNRLRKKTQLLKKEDENELKDFFLPYFEENPELSLEPARKKKRVSNPDSAN